jgi:hypothetical protein
MPACSHIGGWEPRGPASALAAAQAVSIAASATRHAGQPHLFRLSGRSVSTSQSVAKLVDINFYIHFISKAMV